MKFSSIKQTQCTLGDLIDLGVFTANVLTTPGVSRASVSYQYSFGGIIGGWIFGEEASFSTLADFAERAEDHGDFLWRCFRFDVEEYLHTQEHHSMGY